MKSTENFSDRYLDKNLKYNADALGYLTELENNVNYDLEQCPECNGG